MSYLSLNLGKDQRKEVQRVSIRDNSMVLITGRPRTGKTLLAKNIVNQLYYRNIIQFDYSGEWGLSKYPNCFSRDKNYNNYLPSLYRIMGMAYPLNYYTNKADWLSFGMSDSASQIMATLCKYKKVHKNNWQIMKQLVNDLPSGTKKSYEFKQKYGIDIVSVHFQSVENIRKVVSSIDTMMSTKSDFELIHKLVYNFSHVNINMQLAKGNIFSQKSKAKVLVGKTLEIINTVDRGTFLDKQKPVLVFEESDILVPPLVEGEYNSASDLIIQYVLKIGRRAGCLMFFIVQNPQRCDPVILSEYDYIIKHEYTIPFDNRGIFSFASKDIERNPNAYKVKFRPLDSSSQFENYEKQR